jgi:hypothetical protein
LIVSDNLYECPNKIINCSNIGINISIARLLKLLVVDHFGRITRWHLGKLGLGEILQMTQTELGIIWRNEERDTIEA